MRLALFVGDDLHSHILAHQLAAEALGETGFLPVMAEGGPPW